MKETEDGYIDPKSLTPEQLYKLQSGTWGQGYDAGNAGLLQAIKTAESIATARENKRIVELFEATEKHFYEFTVVEGYTQKTHSPVCHLCERIARIKGERK